MKRIGTTSGGGALIEFSKGEVEKIEQGMALLNSLVAEMSPLPADLIAGDDVPDRPESAGLPDPRELLEDYDRVSFARPAASAQRPPRSGRIKSPKPVPAGKKKCIGPCGKTLALDHFYKGQSRCKPCFKIQQAEYKKTKAAAATGGAPTERKARPAADASHKTCTECEVRKPLSEFYANFGTCKRCTLDKQKRAKAAKAATASPVREPIVVSAKAKAALAEIKDKRAGGRGPATRINQAEVIKAGVKALRYGPREHEPLLDRPVNNGRTERVGMDE